MSLATRFATAGCFVALLIVPPIVQGCSSSGKVSLGKDGYSVTTCAATDCGPALGMPSHTCSDGTTAGPTGRCVKVDGAASCSWEVTSCPTSGDCAVPAIGCADGSTAVGSCGHDSSGKCVCATPICPPSGCSSTECGPNPFGAPNYKCSDGSTGGPVCERSSGACGWHIRSCPTEVDAGPTCKAPPPFTCPDGTVVTPSCVVDSSGGCVCSSGTCMGSADAGSTDAIVSDGGSACFDSGGTIPYMYRRCGSDAECATGQHQLNCCGSEQITGINAAEGAAYKSCEAAWDKHFPGCGCPAAMPVADDGKTVSDPTKVAVRCVTGSGGATGICQTYVP